MARPAEARPITVVSRAGSSNQIEANTKATTTRAARLVPCWVQKRNRLFGRARVATQTAAPINRRTPRTAIAISAASANLAPTEDVAPRLINKRFMARGNRTAAASAGRVADGAGRGPRAPHRSEMRLGEQCTERASRAL